MACSSLEARVRSASVSPADERVAKAMRSLTMLSLWRLRMVFSSSNPELMGVLEPNFRNWAIVSFQSM